MRIVMTNKTTLLNLFSLTICIIIISGLLTSCSSSHDVEIIKTKLPAVYNNDYIYFLKKNNHKEEFEDGNDFVLARYNIKSGQEDELIKTNAGNTPRIYNNNIYYFDNEHNDLFAINEKTFKTHFVYSPQKPVGLYYNCYADMGSCFVYSDRDGSLSIKYKKEIKQIDNATDFTVYNNYIYYVYSDYSKNEFYINKLLNCDNEEVEQIVSLRDVLDAGKSEITEQSRISQVDAYNGMLYILITDDFRTNELYAYNLKERTINRIGYGCIYEYQVKDGYIYCREKDYETGIQNLIKYGLNGENGELLIKDITTFAIFDDNIILYTLPHDGNLYVIGDSVDIIISELIL